MVTEQTNFKTEMAVDLGGIAMRNPLTTASGTFASGLEYARFVDLESLGAVTTKGVSPEAWAGNAGVRIAETPSGMLNSIGLQNPGVEAFCARDLAALAEVDVPVIVNVSGHCADDYVRVIERLETEAVAGYEINVSCPNVDAGGLAFGADPAATARIVAACRAATARPLIAKLTPNVTDPTEAALAAVDAGADALSLINTVLGTAVDARRRRFVFDRVVAGLSGPAIKPIALRCVWQVARATDVPILGMGGVATGEDVAEFLVAGATAVAVGTANFTCPDACARILAEFAGFCEREGVLDVHELIGAAL